MVLMCLNVIPNSVQSVITHSAFLIKIYYIYNCYILGVNRDPGFPGRENEHHQQAIEPGACKPGLVKS